MNLKQSILCCTVVAILLITGYLLLLGIGNGGSEKTNISGFNQTKSLDQFKKMENNNMSHTLPEKMRAQIVNIGYSARLYVNRWDVYPEEKIIVINVYEKPSDEQIGVVQNKQIDTWTIKIQYDEDFHNRMMNARNELQTLKKDPAYKIAYYEIEESPFFESPRIWIVVFELTPENQKLNGTKIQGWEIVQVGEVVRPPSQL